MDRVLITGGTGFVGQWMCATHPPDMEIIPISRWYYHNTSWDNQRWDYVVHLAPVSPARALNCGARLLFASSGAAYDQKTEYADNKRKWEKQCQDPTADAVIARLFTFSGQGLDSNKAIVRFEEAARSGSPIRIWGDGSTVRSYMHGSEMGRWMWAILFHGKRGEIYDVGSDVPITMLELAKNINHFNGEKSEIIIDGGQDPMPYYLPRNTSKTKALLTLP